MQIVCKLGGVVESERRLELRHHSVGADVTVSAKALVAAQRDAALG